jgi:hypothetical protein
MTVQERVATLNRRAKCEMRNRALFCIASLTREQSTTSIRSYEHAVFQVSIQKVFRSQDTVIPVSQATTNFFSIFMDTPNAVLCAPTSWIPSLVFWRFSLTRATSESTGPDDGEPWFRWSPYRERRVEWNRHNVHGGEVRIIGGGPKFSESASCLDSKHHEQNRRDSLRIAAGQ